jgi:hypothetical protein
MSTAYEVTFHIVRPNAPTSIEVTASLADIVREAAGLSADSPAWQSLGAKLRAGEPVRVRLGAVQFCRFFLGRRAAENGVRYRLEWNDAVEVEIPDVEVVR